MDPLRSDAPLIVYLDLKSPYAYLSYAPALALERAFGIAIDWRPLTLDIPSYLGSAKVNKTGAVVESKRSPIQWLAVKYAYRDARRYANLRGLTVRGTEKIWDTSLPGIAMLWARRRGEGEGLRRFLHIAYERFWRRELDVEDIAVVTGVLAEAGCTTEGFADYAVGAGRELHDVLQARLHPAGIFGVPTYVIDGERYFGREHLPTVRWLLGGRQGPPPDIAYQ